MKADYAQAFQEAKEWLLHSGIQMQREADARFHGCFADWYDVGKGAYNAAYPEITGYGMQALVFLDSISKDEGLRGKAEAAANWLFSNAAVPFKAGTGFRDKMPLEGAAGAPIVYAFDTGMALEGLVSLHQLAPDAELLQRMERVAKWLASLVAADGSMKPYEASRELPIKWSTQSGSFHAKAANAMLRYAKIRGDADVSNAANSVCKFALQKQMPDGRFCTDSGDGSTYMHAHCYTIEGLLSIGLREKRDEYLKAALKGARWVLKAQLPSGGISRKFIKGKFSPDEGADILSQVIRIWLIAESMGEEGFGEPAEKALERLASFQIASGSKKEKGGMLYGFNAGKLVRNVNSWAAMFALQAFWLATGRNAEKFEAGLLI